jgi:hypothetical protein
MRATAQLLGSDADMTRRCPLACLFLAVGALIGAMAPSPPDAAGSSESAPASIGRLENIAVGYSLHYPAGWRIASQVVATEFASAARCESVSVVDSEPPAGSGPAPSVLRSFVQICARPATDGLSLDEFMRRTYGPALLRSFSAAQLGSRPGYRADSGAAQTTIFLQTRAHRLQIVTGVKAGADLEARRAAEVRAILDSFSIDPRS